MLTICRLPAGVSFYPKICEGFVFKIFFIRSSCKKEYLRESSLASVTTLLNLEYNKKIHNIKIDFCCCFGYKYLKIIAKSVRLSSPMP